MKELDGAGIHRLENILTLSPSLHDFFDQLALWLEAVVFPCFLVAIFLMTQHRMTNRKRILLCLVLERLPRRTVTFTTRADPEALPLPSLTYLAIHAACCRVARLSGAVVYVEEEEVRERSERMGILAKDGTSMDLFDRYMAAISLLTF